MSVKKIPLPFSLHHNHKLKIGDMNGVMRMARSIECVKIKLDRLGLGQSNRENRQCDGVAASSIRDISEIFK